MRTSAENIVIGAVSIVLMIFVLVGNNQIRIAQEQLRSDITILKSQFEMVKLDEFRRDIDAIKTALADLRSRQGALGQQPSRGQQQQGPPPVQNAEVELPGHIPSIGSKDAKVVMIEFSDYLCPFCKRYYTGAYAQIKSDYMDKGKVRYMYWDNPLPMHPNAPTAAQASHCAGDQGKFWPMHDIIFDNQEQGLGAEQLKALAAKLGLNTDDFDKCLTSGKYSQQVQQDGQKAQSIGAQGTPSFLVGTIKNGKVAGKLVRGALPFESFKTEIDALLK